MKIFLQKYLRINSNLPPPTSPPCGCIVIDFETHTINVLELTSNSFCFYFKRYMDAIIVNTNVEIF
jgi:hypothetical protein